MVPCYVYCYITCILLNFLKKFAIGKFTRYAKEKECYKIPMYSSPSFMANLN